MERIKFRIGVTSDSCGTTYTYVFLCADYVYHSENCRKFEVNDGNHKKPIKSWFFPIIFANSENFEKHFK